MKIWLVIGFAIFSCKSFSGKTIVKINIEIRFKILSIPRGKILWMSILNVKTFKSFSYKLNVEELRTNIVKKNLKNAISIYSSFRMETITCTFSLSFISIISNTLSFFSLDFPSVSPFPPTP